MSLKYFKDRVIAYKKDDIYLAVSLEFDLLAEGNSIKEVLDRLEDATKGYLKNCCLDNEKDSEIYRKAPQKYQDLYEIFVELIEKKRKKEAEKKKEESLIKQEIQTLQRLYPNLCYA